MKESSQSQRRIKQVAFGPSYSDVDTEERARKASADRCEAVRRWIDEDDDSACRGID